MVKRKLDVDSDPADLCRGLAAVRGIGFATARRLVAALRPDGRGARACARQQDCFKDVFGN